MAKFLHIRSKKFPILKGEEEETINPGTFGKAFAMFIQTILKDAKYDVPFIVCEDWGWWVEIKLPSKSLGITCYREHEKDSECNFVCSPSPEKQKVLREAFEADPEINFLGESDEMPLF